MDKHERDVEELEVKVKRVAEVIKYLVWALGRYISDEDFGKIVEISRGHCTAQEAKDGPRGKGTKVVAEMER